MSLSSEGMEYDVSDIKSNSDEFKSKFSVLENVSESNKISIWSNKIYLDESMELNGLFEKNNRTR